MTGMRTSAALNRVFLIIFFWIRTLLREFWTIDTILRRLSNSVVGCVNDLDGLPSLWPSLSSGLDVYRFIGSIESNRDQISVFYQRCCIYICILRICVFEIGWLWLCSSRAFVASSVMHQFLGNRLFKVLWSRAV